MAKIEKFNTINDIMEEGMIDSVPRTYLGYSAIGDKCMRKLWYGFRWVAPDSASRRMNRIWDRGHIEEGRIITDLARVGCTVIDQEFEVVGITGHARGHGDGKVCDVPTVMEGKELLFEAKTMKHSSFVSYIKKGLQQYSPAYWQQIHSYMGHEKLPACLYVVVNKDTEERDYKIIEFDEAQFQEGERIAFSIITADVPPPRMANASKNFFECKWCAFSKVCHSEAPVAENCRTCKCWDIEENGKFTCSQYDIDLDKDQQLKGCGMYELDEEAYGI